MIPSQRLIALAILLATPLLVGGAGDVYPDFLPGGPAINISGRSLADIALLLNIVLVVVAGVDLVVSGSPDDIDCEMRCKVAIPCA